MSLRPSIGIVMTAHLHSKQVNTISCKANMHYFVILLIFGCNFARGPTLPRISYKTQHKSGINATNHNKSNVADIIIIIIIIIR